MHLTKSSALLGLIVGAILFVTILIPIIQIGTFIPFLVLAEFFGRFFSGQLYPCAVAFEAISLALKVSLLALLAISLRQMYFLGISVRGQILTMFFAYWFANSFLAIDINHAYHLCYSDGMVLFGIPFFSAKYASLAPILFGVLFEITRLVRTRREAAPAGRDVKDSKTSMKASFWVVLLVFLLSIPVYSWYLDQPASPDTVYESVTFGAREYRTILLNGQLWLADNVNYHIGEDSWLMEGDSQAGRQYTWEGAKRVCEKFGWRLPTDEEWSALVRLYGEYQPTAGKEDPFDLGDREKAYKALFRGGSSGFDAFGDGFHIPYYWTSTPIDEEEAWVYYFYKSETNFRSGKVQRMNWNKSAGHHCRCVKEFE